jgi:hypothetical protein
MVRRERALVHHADDSVTSPTPHADVERLRQRLNMLVLVLPGQFLPIVAAYWLRFLPPFRPSAFDVPAPSPALLLACAAALALPFALPPAWFRPRALERGRLYPALGLRLFRRVATDGDWINARLRRLDPAYRIVRDRRTRDEHIAGTILNERWHSSWLLLGIVTAGAAVATGQYGWAVAVSVSNAAFNLYPVFHQRYKRARLRPAGAAAGRITASSPAAP